MIELREINKTYKIKKQPEVQALKNINLEFGDHGIVFVTGESGGGKSTLMNIIGALDDYDSGELLIDGQSLKNYSNADLDYYRSEYVGFIFQEYNLIDELTVESNLALTYELQGKPIDKTRISECLNEVGLSGYEKRKPNQLSGGQKQRVAVARTLIKHPKILLADEPTGNLDSENGAQLFKILKGISKDILVIVVSHDRISANEFADRIIEIKDGRIEHDSKIEEVNVTATTNTEKVLINSVKKSKSLKLRSILEIGCSFLSKHWMRMVSTMLLFAICLTLISIAISGAIYNPAESEYKALVDNKQKVVHLGIEVSTLGSFTLNEKDTQTLISKKQYELIKDTSANFDFNTIYSSICQTDMITPNIYLDDTIDDTDWFSCYAYSGYTVWENEDVSKFNSTIIAGRLPNNKNEIAITKYVADSYIKYGIYGQENTQTFNNYQDLIGESIVLYFYGNSVTSNIVGIIDTNFDASRYVELKHVEEAELTINESEMLYDLKRDLDCVCQNTIHTAFFVVQELINKVIFDEPTVSVEIRVITGMFGQRIEDTYSSSATKMVSFVKDNYEVIRNDNRESTTDLENNEIIVTENFLKQVYYYENPETTYNSETPERPFVSVSHEDLLAWFSNNEITTDISVNAKKRETFKIVGLIPVDEISIADNSEYNQVFFSDKYIDSIWDYENIYKTVYTTLSGNEKLDKELVNISTSSKIDKNYIFRIRWDLYNEYQDIALESILVSGWCLIFVIVFGVFALIMIANSISTTIRTSQKQLGVLKALGAKTSNVFAIYFVETMIICIVASIAGIVIGCILTPKFNDFFFDMQIMIFTPLQIVLPIIFSIISGFIASYVPIRKICKKKPIDIIRA